MSRIFRVLFGFIAAPLGAAASCVILGVAASLIDEASLTSLVRGLAVGAFIGLFVAAYAFIAWLVCAPFVAVLFFVNLVRWWAFALLGMIAAIGVMILAPPVPDVFKHMWRFYVTGASSGIAFWLMVFEE